MSEPYPHPPIHCAKVLAVPPGAPFGSDLQPWETWCSLPVVAGMECVIENETRRQPDGRYVPVREWRPIPTCPSCLRAMAGHHERRRRDWADGLRPTTA